YYWFADNPAEFLQHYADYRQRVAGFYAVHGAAPQLTPSDFQRVLDITHAMYFAKACPPEYFHSRLQAYWPDDRLVKEPADLFQLMRSERTLPRRGMAARLARKLLRGLRIFRARVGPAAPIDHDVQAVCRHPWVCQLPRRMKWLAADQDFRAAYRELCVYLDASLPGGGAASGERFRIGERVIGKNGKLAIATAEGRSIALIDRGPEGSELAGAVEAATADGNGQIVLQGWAIDPAAARPAGAVIVIAQGRLATWGIPRTPRPDIACGFGAAYENCGFRIHLPQVPRGGRDDARAYAVLQDGTARELSYAVGIFGSPPREGGHLSKSAGPVGSRFLAYLAASAATWSCVFLTFVWIVDPYGVSPVHLTVAGFNQLKPKRVDIDRLIKPYEVWRYQPRTVFFGTSRINESFDPAALEGSAFAPAYNAAIPASEINQAYENLDQYF